MKKFLLIVENDNPCQAGWLACHMGLPKDALKLEGLDKESWDAGWDMRQQTADMEDAHDVKGHGNCHVAFLMESTNPLKEFVRHKVSVEVKSCGG